LRGDSEHFEEEEEGELLDVIGAGEPSSRRMWQFATSSDVGIGVVITTGALILPRWTIGVESMDCFRVVLLNRPMFWQGNTSPMIWR
jgi:hypothetical protein